MSMPKFPNKDKLPTREQSLNAIIASIAMEEVALSHVLTAESEKIKYVIENAKAKDYDPTSINDLLAVNKSAGDLIKTVKELQLILKDKFAIASNNLPPCPPCPPWPPQPPIPPKPPCPYPKGMSVFETAALYTWCQGKSLFWVDNNPCDNGVKLVRKNGQTLLTLPGNKKINIHFALDAINYHADPVAIEMDFLHGNKIVKQEIIAAKKNIRNIELMYEVSYKTPTVVRESAITCRLVSPESLSDVRAVIAIKVK